MPINNRPRIEMLAATVIGVILVPVLYAALQGGRERMKRLFGGRAETS